MNILSKSTEFGLLATIVGLCFLCPVVALGSGTQIDKEISADSDQVVEEARLEVIQKRKYSSLHELSFLGGGLPVDPYYKGITGSVGYALHFNDSFAWEILQFTYSLNVDTKLKKNLVRMGVSQGDDPGEFPEIQWIGASHLVLKPLYGKEAWFNTRLVHTEVYLQAGPIGLRRVEKSAASILLGFDVGFGLRLWLYKWASLRFDVVEMVYFSGSKSKTALRLAGGIAFNLRGED